METALQLLCVDLPSDVTDDPEERARLAFLGAEEMTHDWIVPCEWSIHEDTGETVIVARRFRRQALED